MSRSSFPRSLLDLPLVPENVSSGGTAAAVPSATAQTQATQPTQTGSSSGKGTPAEVADAVRQDVAQKLHLSVSQLQTKLQSGTGIETLAIQQGLSQDQWHTFVLDTYQTAYSSDVGTGKITQQLADHDMKNIKSYPLSALDDWVTTDCLGNAPAGK